MSGIEIGVRELRQQQPAFEPFRYPEAPWTEQLSGISERLAELFPTALPDLTAPQERNPSTASPKSPDRDSMSRAGLAYAGSADLDIRMDTRMEPRLGEECLRAEEQGYTRGLEQGINQGFEQGLAQGLNQGRSEAEQQLEAERKRLIARAAALTESLDASRHAYFQQVEQETARLALAIAARILRREVQMDPLLLTGAVRVALGQLAEATSVRLHVPARDRGMWQEALALIPRLMPRPEVVGEERMESGECRMETELGSVDLGLWSQLKETERGFFAGVVDEEARVQS